MRETQETIRNHFQFAKRVKCLVDGKVHELKHPIKIHRTVPGIICADSVVKGEMIRVFQHGTYAEIVEFELSKLSKIKTMPRFLILDTTNPLLFPDSLGCSNFELDEEEFKKMFTGFTRNRYKGPSELMAESLKSDSNEDEPKTRKISDFPEHIIPIDLDKLVLLNTPAHYDNSKGTLYKVAQERGWNPYLFDIVKRLERAEKKGEFETDLEKSINVIKLWLEESKQK